MKIFIKIYLVLKRQNIMNLDLTGKKSYTTVRTSNVTILGVYRDHHLPSEVIHVTEPGVTWASLDRVQTLTENP